MSSTSPPRSPAAWGVVLLLLGISIHTCCAQVHNHWSHPLNENLNPAASVHRQQTQFERILHPGVRARIAQLQAEIDAAAREAAGGDGANHFTSGRLGQQWREQVTKAQWTIKKGDASFTAKGNSTKTQAQMLSDIKALITKVMQCKNIPGITIGIVFPDGSTATLPLGLRDTEKGLPVDNDTLFGIGSTSKAFTATLIAMLVDEGKVDFNGRVGDYLPGWRLQNGPASELVSIHDLLSHRTGLPRNDDAIFNGNPYSRYDLAYKQQYLHQAAAIRTQFLYNNFQFSVAGLLAGQMSTPPMTWEQLVSKRIFQPLGMTNTYANFEMTKKASQNIAIPSVMVNGKWVQLNWESNYVIDPVAPAGAINSNANNITAWLKLHLKQGVGPDGTALVSAASLQDTYRAANPLPTSIYTLYKPVAPVDQVSTDYGMGWIRASYRGYQRIWHNGGTLGHSTSMNIFPAAGVGIFMSVNTLDENSEDPIVQYIFDTVMGIDPYIKAEDICSWPCTIVSPSVKWPGCAPAPDPPSPVPTPPLKPDPVEVSTYVGKYYHPTYGYMNASVSGDGKLQLAYEALAGELIPYNGDTFIWAPASKLFPQPELESTIKKSTASAVSFQRSPQTSQVSHLIWARVRDVTYETVFTLQGSPPPPPASGCGFVQGTGPQYMPQPTSTVTSSRRPVKPVDPNNGGGPNGKDKGEGFKLWAIIVTSMACAALAGTLAYLWGRSKGRASRGHVQLQLATGDGAAYSGPHGALQQPLHA